MEFQASLSTNPMPFNRDYFPFFTRDYFFADASCKRTESGFLAEPLFLF